MKSRSSAGAMPARQKTFAAIAFAIVFALLVGGVTLFSSVGSITANAETPTIASWYVDPTTAEKAPDAEGNLISVKLKASPVSFSCATTYTADSTHGYIVVKYSGTATFHELSIYGTKDGGEEKSGVVAAVAGNGWNVSKNVGSDFSIVVAQVGGYYGASELDLDTVTNIGFTVTGEVDDTFTVHAIEVLPDANHNLGTPTPPVVEGDLTIGDMVATENAESPNPLGVSKSEGEQTVSFSSAPGWNTVTAQVNNYTSDYKYLYLEFTPSDKITMSVRAGNDTYLTTPWTQEIFASGKNVRVVDLSAQSLNPSFQLVFCFNANDNPGAEYSDTPKTVVFHEISFRETDPTASDEDNHFRTPTGSNLSYSDADKKISYTNSRTDYYRYLEILLENHDTDYDVLSLDITGYNGLVLGVRVLFEDELDGEVTAATLDVIPSSAYYSEIKTDERTEIVVYLEPYGIKGCVVTGVQLYCDAPAAAGKDGDVEITLHNIEMLSSAALEPAAVTVTAQDETITYGDAAPDFGLVLKAGDETITGSVITEYRLVGSSENYTAGLPTDAGEYEVRFYYMGTRAYNYSRSVVKILTIEKAAAVNATAEDGISFDETTRAVTVKDGYEASTSATFASGNAVADGYVIPYGETKTIYYRTVAADNNHLAGEIKSKEFTAPAAPAEEKTLSGIAVTTQPTKTAYTVGDTLDTTGLVVTATYSDESTAPVTVTTDMLSDYDMSKAGIYHVKVTYEGKTATFDITVAAATVTPEKTLSGIAITTKPTKTAYTVGDTLDLTGLVVTATYSDGSSVAVTVTAAMVSDYDLSKVGTYKAKVTYEGKTATFDITVRAAQKPADDGKEGMSVGAKVGIIVAVIAVVGAAAVAVVLVLKKKKNA